VDDFEGEIVCNLADIEVSSAKTEVFDSKRKTLVSINRLNYKAPEKSLATEEIVGYNTQCYLELYVFRFLVLIAPLMKHIQISFVSDVWWHFKYLVHLGNPCLDMRTDSSTFSG